MGTDNAKNETTAIRHWTPREVLSGSHRKLASRVLHQIVPSCCVLSAHRSNKLFSREHIPSTASTSGRECLCQETVKETAFVMSFWPHYLYYMGGSIRMGSFSRAFIKKKLRPWTYSIQYWSTQVQKIFAHFSQEINEGIILNYNPSASIVVISSIEKKLITKQVIKIELFKRRQNLFVKIETWGALHAC